MKEEKKGIKKGRGIGIAITAVLTLLFWLALTTSIGGATAVNVTPPTREVLAGDNFGVNITIENVTNMKTYGAKLNFDPRAMNALEIIEGGFLKSGGTTLFLWEINNTEGFAIFGNTFLPGGTPVNGSGVLATINFNTSKEADGTYDLNLTEAMINTTAGKIPVDVYNGTVKILGQKPITVPGLSIPGILVLIVILTTVTVVSVQRKKK